MNTTPKITPQPAASAQTLPALAVLDQMYGYFSFARLTRRPAQDPA
ncbi:MULTISPECIES: hypothetical protein [unclassified Paracoccus (in: a-proteobacteria)]|nr:MULTISPECIES: hypothetical protein [unclassified Paracoccus (in: a-proteobacteria)]UXU75272.1 hypothetical protein GB879_001845 [Paracoccus sp. SMMA_5]UXU81174.1 hypothetical protein GB880_001840 [Paracoccus sp. SMMA_5_TC]